MFNSLIDKQKKNKITAIISDDDCMRPDFWVDYETQSKNEEFIANTKQAKELGPEHFLEYVKHALPEWIVGECDAYDEDLSQLSRNWSHLCNRFNVPTQKILLVSHISFMNEETKSRNKCLNLVCDILTSLGYVVKDKHHFSLCPKCNRLTLSVESKKMLWATNKVSECCRSCK